MERYHIKARICTYTYPRIGTYIVENSDQRSIVFIYRVYNYYIGKPRFLHRKISIKRNKFSPSYVKYLRNRRFNPGGIRGLHSL
jgi:hypothetical protein